MLPKPLYRIIRIISCIQFFFPAKVEVTNDEIKNSGDDDEVADSESKSLVLNIHVH